MKYLISFITGAAITYGVQVWLEPNASSSVAIRTQLSKCNSYTELLSKMNAVQDRINKKLKVRKI